MKKFDGIHPCAYETIFGIINIDPDEEKGWFVVKKITESPVMYPVVVDYDRIVGLRRFKNRTKCYQFIRGMELRVADNVKKLLSEIV